jgi:hypothetical protein
VGASPRFAQHERLPSNARWRLASCMLAEEVGALLLSSLSPTADFRVCMSRLCVSLLYVACCLHVTLSIACVRHLSLALTAL